ncbi:MAG: DHA2 family efflux MFS transporter permease subunit [Solirubrobacteraceae bacterium]
MTSNSALDKIPAHVWRISAVVVLGSIMSILDTTIVNVALETLSRDLHTSIDGIQWVATGYLLSLAAVIPVTGWAARRFGAKPIYLISLVLFTAGSALCGFATSAPELIVFRVLQGIGGGMILPVGQLMMAEAAGPKRMGRVMSVVAVPAMLAPILGPMIGGLILEHLAWRWIFFVNVPIGIFAVIAAARILPKVARKPTEALDYKGLAMLAIGLPLITYGLAEIGTTDSFTAFRVIGPIVAGVVLVAAFAIYSLRVKLPILNLRLYSRATFSTGSIAMFCVGAALFGGMILLPLYWQTVRGESVFVTGLLTAPQGLGAALILPLSGKLTDRLGGGPLTLFGVLLTAAATVPFALIGPHTSILWLCAMMVVRGFGIGFCFIPAMAAAYAALEHHELSDATPQLNILQRVGGSIGIAVVTVVLQRGLNSALTQPPAHRLAAAASAYGSAFWWSVGLTLAAVIPAIVLIRAERAARRAHAHAPAPDEAALAEAVAA